MTNLVRTYVSPFLKSLTFNSVSGHQLQTSSNLFNWINFSRKFGTSGGGSFLQYAFNQNSLSRPLLPGVPITVSATRNVTKFSLKTGKKKSVRAVLTRFYRLNCGLWIRRRAGCHKRLHQKSLKELFGLRQHVVCTETQCIMLDKMVTDHWKKKRYYIDDPFEPYQVRNNFDWVPPFRKR